MRPSRRFLWHARCVSDQYAAGVRPRPPVAAWRPLRPPTSRRRGGSPAHTCRSRQADGANKGQDGQCKKGAAIEDDVDVEALCQFFVPVADGDFRHACDLGHFALRPALARQDACDVDGGRRSTKSAQVEMALLFMEIDVQDGGEGLQCISPDYWDHVARDNVNRAQVHRVIGTVVCA